MKVPIGAVLPWAGKDINNFPGQLALIKLKNSTMAYGMFEPGVTGVLHVKTVADPEWIASHERSLRRPDAILKILSRIEAILLLPVYDDGVVITGRAEEVSPSTLLV